MDTQNAFRKDSKIRKTIYDSQDKSKNPYDTCVELKKCPGEDTPEGAKLYQKIFGTECEHDLGCDEGSTPIKDECWICYWAVKIWPPFTGICAKASGGSEPSNYKMFTSAEKSPAVNFLEQGAGQSLRALPKAAKPCEDRECSGFVPSPSLPQTQGCCHYGTRHCLVHPSVWQLRMTNCCRGC